MCVCFFFVRLFGDGVMFGGLILDDLSYYGELKPGVMFGELMWCHV